MKTFAEELDELRRNGLYRSMRVVNGSQGPSISLDGREVLLLCSNNYLGLADHPRLKNAAIEATASFGVSSGASRLVSGTMELHHALERKIASFKGTDSALVFNSGYAANMGIIESLVGRGDVIFSDRLNHASIVDGCLLSRARLIRYPHKDMVALRRLLDSNPTEGRRLIVTDGAFSMDGDLAPLPELVALKHQYGALLMVDDAHGTGVFGPGGRGSAAACGSMAEIDIHMGTLGKAVGSFGAYAAASNEIIEYLVNRARSFIFSTSLPPGVLAASLAAFEVIDSQEGSDLRERLRMNAEFLRGELERHGFDTLGSESQIIPVAVGDAGKTMEFTRLLLENGVFVQGIRPPTVPSGTCRLRCTVMATHAIEDLEKAATAITSIGKHLGII